MAFILNIIVFFIVASIFEFFISSFIEHYSLIWWLLIACMFIITDVISEKIAPTPVGSIFTKNNNKD